MRNTTYHLRYFTNAKACEGRRLGGDGMYLVCNIKRFFKHIILHAIFFSGVFASSSTLAQAWITLGTSGFSVGIADYTSMAIDTGGTPYIVYSDEGIGQKASVMKYSGNSWINVGSAGFSASYTNYTNIAIDNRGTPYVVYEDGLYLTDTAKATVMKYVDSNWINVGLAGFSAGQVEWTSIAIDASGTPYVVFQDGADSNKATVMKYNDSSWVIVGSAGISTGPVQYTSIAIDKNGIPYVAYQDIGNNSKATVMKYNGSNWVSVGSAGFSAGEARYTSITIDGSGTPYVAFADSDWKATVMKFNGSDWVRVGNAGLSVGQVFYTSIAIDNTGVPYVSFTHWDYDSRATVMKYNGSNWITVAKRGFSAGHTQFTSIAIDNTGTPYVAYQDISNKATVVKLDTSLSPITGLQTLCVGSTTTLSDLKSGGTWSSSNTIVATIDSSGFVMSLATGTTTISYTKSNYSTTFNILVDSLPVVGGMSANVDSICPGDSIIIFNSVDDGRWVSMDTSIAVFKSDMYISRPLAGLLVGISSGLATLDYINSNNCGSDTGSYSFLVGCSSAIKIVTPPPTNPLPTKLTIFPNPALHIVNISAPDTIHQITIIDILGQVAYSYQFNLPKVQMNVTDLPAGVYFLKVNDIEIRKFIKQ